MAITPHRMLCCNTDASRFPCPLPCRPGWDESIWPSDSPPQTQGGVAAAPTSSEPQSTHIIGNMLYSVHQPFDSPGNPFSLKVIRKSTNEPIFDSHGHRCAQMTLSALRCEATKCTTSSSSSSGLTGWWFCQQMLHLGMRIHGLATMCASDACGVLVTCCAGGQTLCQVAHTAIPTLRPSTTADHHAPSIPASRFLFKDQYIEISTDVPEDADLYGLGEVTIPTGLKLPRDNRIITLFNADTSSLVPYRNLYGSHPFLLQVNQGVLGWSLQALWVMSVRQLHSVGLFCY
jgi:hypothetical protein